MDTLDTPGATNALPSFWNTVLRHAGICAGAFIAFSLLTYLLDFNMMSLSSMAIQFVCLFGIAIGVSVMAIRFQRDRLDGGYISFGRALLIGLLVTAIAFFILSIWNYILMNFIDPGYVDNLKEKFVQTWGDNMPAEAMEEAVKNFDKSAEIGTNLKNGIGGGLFVGLISGLIAAGFMKRDRPVV